ncbi:ankyrin repeat domain-containing protein [Lentzea tibetensis]|uniref:Ankyrin repeat domain-containing protein n=1 Tax=Lentzea tibetensis TaxID=2591470 RepID=A0A563EKK9_9PSEU|nr:ankyrin repeat domain-containing protein [Lentzea tibetensis]TWP47589.1 ankyrin repeat domain-containing protein [Lentzea tibetensis]
MDLVTAVSRRRADIAVVRRLLDEGADPGQSREDGAPVLTIAAGHFNAELVELLLARLPSTPPDGPVVKLTEDRFLVRGDLADWVWVLRQAFGRWGDISFEDMCGLLPDGLPLLAERFERAGGSIVIDDEDLAMAYSAAGYLASVAHVQDPRVDLVHDAIEPID